MNYRKLAKKLFNLSFIGRNFDHNYQGPSSFPRRRHVVGGGGGGWKWYLSSGLLTFPQDCRAGKDARASE